MFATKRLSTGHTNTASAAIYRCKLDRTALQFAGGHAKATTKLQNHVGSDLLGRWLCALASGASVCMFILPSERSGALCFQQVSATRRICQRRLSSNRPPVENEGGKSPLERGRLKSRPAPLDSLLSKMKKRAIPRIETETATGDEPPTICVTPFLVSETNPTWSFCRTRKAALTTLPRAT